MPFYLNKSSTQLLPVECYKTDFVNNGLATVHSLAVRHTQHNDHSFRWTAAYINYLADWHNSTRVLIVTVANIIAQIFRMKAFANHNIDWITVGLYFLNICEYVLLFVVFSPKKIRVRISLLVHWLCKSQDISTWFSFRENPTQYSQNVRVWKIFRSVVKFCFVLCSCLIELYFYIFKILLLFIRHLNN